MRRHPRAIEQKLMFFQKKTAVRTVSTSSPALRAQTLRTFFTLLTGLTIAALCAVSAADASAGETPKAAAPFSGVRASADAGNPVFDSQLENFRRAILSGDLSGVKNLLSAGLTPNMLMAGGDTAFTYALRTDHPNLALAMIESGKLDVNRANEYGETPLMMAVFKGQKNVFDKLIAGGADVNGGKGWTALHYAATEGRADFVAELLKLGADPNAQTRAGVTPLMMAARKPSREAAVLLLRAGAYRDYCTDKGMSPADFASKAGDEELGRYLAVETCAVKGKKPAAAAAAPSIR